MRNEQDIIKHNYLIEHIEKGSSKVQETMIISSFCFDCRLKDLKPIFQYSIKKENDTSYFFYDLYFPAINTIIEINEEHHESPREQANDKEKEQRAKNVLKCNYFTISFHEKYGIVSDQIEAVKLFLLDQITQAGVENTKWIENQFDPINYLQNVEKTIIVSISPFNNIYSLNKMPLQISKEIHNLESVNVIYLTGGTGTVATAYKVKSTDWGINQGSSFHSGEIDYENPILTSGSTFYKSTRNILMSPDLEQLCKKKK